METKANEALAAEQAASNQLVARLRDVQSIRRDATPLSVAVALCHEAADEIERLTRLCDHHALEATHLRRAARELVAKIDCLCNSPSQCEVCKLEMAIDGSDDVALLQHDRECEFYQCRDDGMCNCGAIETPAGQKP